MEEQGKIVSTCDIDTNLALQMWTRGKTPRLSIMNKNKNSRKLIHISWVEKRNRTLAINGKKAGETFNYVVKDFESAIQKILEEYAARTNFKVKYLKLVIDLEKAINHPETISTQGDFAMMTDEKRSSLWIADCSGGDRNSGVFRPFFPLNDDEAAVIPEEKMTFSSLATKNTEGLIKTGAVSELKRVNPERWHNTVRVTAAAMLLGFSYCGGDGSKTADALWTAGEKPKNLNPNVTVMKTPVKKLSINDPDLIHLGHKLAAYIRHFYYADKVDIRYIIDSNKELRDAGFEKTRRIDFNTGTLGDVPYRVTFYENAEREIMAFGCNPRMQTARHTGDMVIMIPTEIYKNALKNDSIGGSSENDFFTIIRLLWARQFKAWYLNLKPYVKKFAGLIEN